MSGAGASQIVAPNVRDLDELARALRDWLAERLPGSRGLELHDFSYPLGAGMSHETILFEAAWRDGEGAHRQGMVVRIKPTKDTVYQDDMFEAQYRLMQLMHHGGQVRVAKPLWFEADPALLGAPFFVMERVRGRVPVSHPPYSREGWLFDAAPAERRRMWEDAVRQLAAVARVPTSQACFLQLPGAFAEDFDQEVDRWRRFMDWVDPTGELSLLRNGFDRLQAARPANRAEGIVWGDARLGNMMVGPDFTVVAVMDWEQPSLGGALHDLGWWLYSDHNQTAAQGLPRLEGMGTKEETVALWSEVSGASSDGVAWYEAFAAFKMECLAVRMAATRRLPGARMRVAPGSRLAALMKAAPDWEQR